MNGLVHVGAWDGAEYLDSDRPLFLIEPQADAYRRLVANFEGRPGVTLANFACGSGVQRSADLHITEPDHSSSLLEPNGELLEGAFGVRATDRVERVAMTTLDRLMRGADLDHWSELVIDTQGYELEVLRGAEATLTGIRRLTVEVSTVEFYEGQPMADDINQFLFERWFTQKELILHAPTQGNAIYERTL